MLFYKDIYMPPSGTANIIKRKQSEMDNKKLKYPSDIENTGHYMIYLPKKYEYSGGKIGFRQIKDSKKAIVLPLPRNLSESYGASWEAESLGPVASNIARFVGNNGSDVGNMDFKLLKEIAREFLTEAVISAGARGAEAKGVELGTAAGIAIGGGGLLGSVLGAGAAAAATGVLSGAKAAYGIAANPYLSLLFQGVGLRSYSFTYEFFAKSPEESIEVKKITDRFRHSMLPQYNTALKGSGRALFDFPDIFHIGFMQNEFLFSFKPCALTNMSINYHQQGDAFYFDLNGKKIPASIQIGLEFRELEIVIKDDFDDENTIKSESNFNSVLYNQIGSP